MARLTGLLREVEAVDQPHASAISHMHQQSATCISNQPHASAISHMQQPLCTEQVLEWEAGGEKDLAIRHVEPGSGVAGAGASHPSCVPDQPTHCCSAGTPPASQVSGDSRPPSCS